MVSLFKKLHTIFSVSTNTPPISVVPVVAGQQILLNININVSKHRISNN